MIVDDDEALKTILKKRKVEKVKHRSQVSYFSEKLSETVEVISSGNFLRSCI